MSHSLDAYLILSCALFAIGTFGFLARRNAISMLMSIELMLNGVNLAIVAFGSFGTAAAAAADRAASVAEGSVIALVLALAIGATDWGEAAKRVRLTAEAMSSVLFNSFVLPFEIVSVLLLAAVIGGVYLAKREPGGPS